MPKVVYEGIFRKTTVTPYEICVQKKWFNCLLAAAGLAAIIYYGTNIRDYIPLSYFSRLAQQETKQSVVETKTSPSGVEVKVTSAAQPPPAFTAPATASIEKHSTVRVEVTSEKKTNELENKLDEYVDKGVLKSFLDFFYNSTKGVPVGDLRNFCSLAGFNREKEYPEEKFLVFNYEKIGEKKATLYLKFNPRSDDENQRLGKYFGIFGKEKIKEHVEKFKPEMGLEVSLIFDVDLEKYRGDGDIKIEIKEREVKDSDRIRAEIGRFLCDLRFCSIIFSGETGLEKRCLDILDKNKVRLSGSFYCDNEGKAKFELSS